MQNSIASFIDHTYLKPDINPSITKKICNEFEKYSFASICIPPGQLKEAQQHLSSHASLCTVLAFPFGYETLENKIKLAQNYVQLGAQEIDMVLSLHLLKEHQWDEMTEEISEVKKVLPSTVLKIIIETAYLNAEEITQATHACINGQADFIKTSTGFAPSGAQLKDIELMAKVATGHSLKIKASGGIQTFEQAQIFLNAGAHRLGTSSGVSITEKFLEMNL